jgi:hypothetical protein
MCSAADTVQPGKKKTIIKLRAKRRVSFGIIGVKIVGTREHDAQVARGGSPNLPWGQ